MLVVRFVVNVVSVNVVSVSIIFMFFIWLVSVIGFYMVLL